ncbi:orotate phosphoribosyltransferase [Synechococcus sp. 65AY6Li]|nr:orotate phosphoribosyltransferase [Synechococcus sp. 65AY6Li]
MTVELMGIPAVLLLDCSPLGLSSAEAREKLLYLLAQLAYREGSFTLTSGQQSTYYINCKPVTLHPQGAYLVGSLLHRLLPPETEAVAGMTLGADPLVTAVSLASLQAEPANLAALIVRKEPKGHGTQAWIEGPELPAGSRVWILEDVVTTGGSALKAVERVRAAGYRAEGILALVDRLEGAEARYREMGIPFRRLFTLEEVRACHQSLRQGLVGWPVLGGEGGSQACS